MNVLDFLDWLLLGTWWGIISLLCLYLLLTLIIWARDIFVWGQLSLVLTNVTLCEPRIKTLADVAREEKWQRHLVWIGRLLGWLMLGLMFMICIIAAGGHLLVTVIFVLTAVALWAGVHIFSKKFDLQDADRLPFLVERIHQLEAIKARLLAPPEENKSDKKSSEKTRK